MATLKKSLLIFVILFGLTNVLFPQNNNDSLNVENSVSVSEDSTLLQDDYFSSNNETSNLNLKQPSTAWTFIKMILFLCLVVAAIYAVMWFFKKKVNNTKSDDNFLRRVSSLNIGPGKSVEIVTLLDNAYILGVTDSNINVIDQIEDKENGTYLVLSKFEDDVTFEYHITIQDEGFNLGVLTMRAPEGVFQTDFDE